MDLHDDPGRIENVDNVAAMIYIDTLDFWTIPAPYPCGPFDVHALLNFSFNFEPFVTLAGDSLSLVRVDVINHTGLIVSPVSIDQSVATLQIEKEDKTTDIGRRLSFTLRAFLSDGQHDDRTFLLEMRNR